MSLFLFQNCRLFDSRRDEFARTFDRLRGSINIETCSWAPGYYAIAAARLKRR